MLFSRVTAALAEQARNLFPGGASEELLARADEGYSLRGPFQVGDRIELNNGRHSLLASRLAIGTGSDGWAGASNQTRQLGIHGVGDLLQHAFEVHNINFWDSADQYGSHPHVAEGLKRVKREDVVILTKTVAESAAAMRKDLDRFRQEMNTDVIDILLLHCMTTGNWPKYMAEVMDVISEAQEAGIIKIKGVSCHSFAALKTASTHPWVEFDLARINPGGFSMDAKPDQVVPVLDQFKENNKLLMGMKILGNARLADRKPEALRFALGLDCLDCFTIGFENQQELDEVVGIINGDSRDPGSGIRDSGKFNH